MRDGGKGTGKWCEMMSWWTRDEAIRQSSDSGPAVRGAAALSRASTSERASERRAASRVVGGARDARAAHPKAQVRCAFREPAVPGHAGARSYNYSRLRGRLEASRPQTGLLARLALRWTGGRPRRPAPDDSELLTPSAMQEAVFSASCMRSSRSRLAATRSASRNSDHLQRDYGSTVGYASAARPDATHDGRSPAAQVAAPLSSSPPRAPPIARHRTVAPEPGGRRTAQQTRTQAHVVRRDEARTQSTQPRSAVGSAQLIMLHPSTPVAHSSCMAARRPACRRADCCLRACGL